MSEGPKLYSNKPKKAHLKQFQERQKAQDFSSPSSSSTMGTPSAPPPPQPPKESFARRYKFLWPLLLTVNLAVGGYLFMRTKKKDTSIKEEEVAKEIPPSQISSTPAQTASIIEKPLPITKPMRLLEPIHENQQRELFKWMLEEKRKFKPKDSEEKKRIDEEKTILKQFIRAKSIPRI